VSHKHKDFVNGKRNAMANIFLPTAMQMASTLVSLTFAFYLLWTTSNDEFFDDKRYTVKVLATQQAMP